VDYNLSLLADMPPSALGFTSSLVHDDNTIAATHTANTDANIFLFILFVV
jgi:hypothetical protein